MSNQYPPPNPPPPGYGTPYGTPQMQSPLTPPTGGPGGKTGLGLDSNVGSMLCYIGNLLCCAGLILSVIFLVTEKENRFVRFHALQALFLAGAAIVVSLLLGILAVILSVAHLGILALGLRIIVSFVFLALWIIAGIKAYQGEKYKLPVIGDLADNMSA